MKSKVSETTQLLFNWAAGDAAALEALTPHIYRELRRMAAGLMKREPDGNTLEATALVHEVYLKLVDSRQTAAVLRVSAETVTRDWRLAWGWLVVEVGKAAPRARRGVEVGLRRWHPVPRRALCAEVKSRNEFVTQVQ